MCGIIGIFNDKNAPAKIKLGLKLLEKRGKDGVGVASESGVIISKSIGKLKIPASHNLLGHTLHSIVDFVPQPLKESGILVANCEIYNWKELAQKHRLSVNNDAELLLQFLDMFEVTENALNELDGVYAFAYWKKNKLFLARDILGVKPMWFSQDKSFGFASERKVLRELGYKDIQELTPRHILEYDIRTNNIKIHQRKFFTSVPELHDKKEIILGNTSKLLEEAIIKRIPERKFGVLFSGGIDSTYIAHFLIKHGCEFTCYTAALDSPEHLPSDLVYAQKAAKEMGLKLKVRTIKMEEIPAYLKKVIPLIEDSHPVKVSVALTFFLACELAQKDGCKVIFSGLGSEEIFAGYERHKHSTNLNLECVSGLLKLYERDLYRDDVITMHNGLELRLPFLDKKLIEYALRIPEKYKINSEQSKLIFREIAYAQGISHELAFRKKVAAQYGSRIDSALDKVSRWKKFSSRPTYLRTFYPFPNAKLGVLFSSGKDSTYAALMMNRQGYELTCLITLQSENQDSYMFHTPAIELAKLQARAMEIPLILYKTKGEKEIELEDLKKALVVAKKKYKIEGIVTGALFSTYQRDRIERVADGLGLKIFSPLWHKSQEQEMQELLENGFEFILTSVAAEGLDKGWLNRIITKEDVVRLKNMKDKLGTNIAGEGGEFESLVLDCPLFKKKMIIEKAKILEESRNTARMVIQKAKLVKKTTTTCSKNPKSL